MRLKFALYLCIISSSLFCVSCKDKTRAHNLTPDSETKEQLVQKLSEEDKQAIDKFRKDLSQSLDDGDKSFLSDNINVEQLAKIALEGLDLSKSEKNKFITGFMSSATANLNQFAENIAQTDTRYIKFINESRPALLFRSIKNADGTFYYVEFHLSKKQNNEWEIVDLYFYSNGKTNATMLRASIAASVGKTEKNKIHQEAIAKTSIIHDKIRVKDYQQAWEIWKEIDPQTHTDRNITRTGYKAAFQHYINSPYESAQQKQASNNLSEIFNIIHKHFPNDPGFAIIELGLHDLNKDYVKYRAAVNTIKSIVGKDLYLDLLDTNADLAEKKFDAAIIKANAFREQEPHINKPYYVLWDAYMSKKDYTGVALTFDQFEEHFGLDHNLLIKDTSFNDFFTSEVGKAWLKSKGL